MVATAYQQSRKKASKATGTRDTGTKKPARYRTLHKFWLDLNTTADANLNDCIDNLKRYRMFTPTIRDGIRLVVSLRERSLDVLFELFPWVCDWLDHEIERRMNARLMDRAGDVSDLKAQLARLEALINTPQPAPGPRPQPVPDDGDTPQLVVTKAKSDGKTSAANFLQSALNLVQ